MAWYKDKRVLHLDSIDTMFKVLQEKGRPLRSFKKGDTVHVWNRMEKDYSYVLTCNPGENFDPTFKPYADPGEILALGAFGGKYLNDCLLEFPAEWFWRAGLLDKLRPVEEDITVNYFQIDSRLGLSQWKEKGWVPTRSNRGLSGGNRELLADPSKNPDVRGWFQWYCRYWMGRREEELDAIQIKRWRAFSRHLGAVSKNCSKGDVTCRPRQRQALLHWAWPFND